MTSERRMLYNSGQFVIISQLTNKKYLYQYLDGKLMAALDYPQ